jgi:hypothetical protein
LVVVDAVGAAEIEVDVNGAVLIVNVAVIVVVVGVSAVRALSWLIIG